jgi:hypothetical protein
MRRKGDFENLIKSQMGDTVEEILKFKQDRPYRVYFDQRGEITYFGNDDIKIDPEWLTHDFTPDQLSVLQNAKTEKFCVVKDRLIDNLYSIQTKTYEVTHRKQQHLEEINQDILNADIVCEMHDDKICFTMGSALRSQIGQSKLSVKTLTFYLTAKGDPHWLFKRLVVPADRMLKKKIVFKTNIKAHKDDLSIYTKKVFDTYALKVL